MGQLSEYLVVFLTHLCASLFQMTQKEQTSVRMDITRMFLASLGRPSLGAAMVGGILLVLLLPLGVNI